VFNVTSWTANNRVEESYVSRIAHLLCSLRSLVCCAFEVHSCLLLRSLAAEAHGSRYDAEDEDFGSTLVNHRNLYLRTRLTSQRQDHDEGGLDGAVVYDEEAEDFWQNAGESPLAGNNAPVGDAAGTKGEKKPRFFGF
jgi:hypothetical protein